MSCFTLGTTHTHQNDVAPNIVFKPVDELQKPSFLLISVALPEYSGHGRRGDQPDQALLRHVGILKAIFLLLTYRVLVGRVNK